MKKLFVPYGIALKLREKGFDEECVGYYCGKDKEVNVGNCDVQPPFKPRLDSKVIFSAPTWQQAIDFLRDMHRVHIYFYLNEGKDAYNIVIESENFISDEHMPFLKSFEYYEALEIGIEEAIKLI